MKHNFTKIKQVVCLGSLVVLGFSGISAWASASSEEKKVQEIVIQESEDHESGNQEAVHWGYSGNTGPAYWGELLNPLCGSGQRQSPVDFRVERSAHLYSLEFHYQPVVLQVLNNGHTLQANYASNTDVLEISVGEHSYPITQSKVYDSVLMLGDVPYNLIQFHFHTPSEHARDGNRYAMEVHLVHQSADGNLAVVGMFLKRGGHNPVLQKVLDNVSSTIDKVNISKKILVNANDLLPQNREYFHYSGSLTTPPCSENVNWIFMKTPLQVSDQQVRRFAELVGENARPIQDLNWREMLVSN